MDSDSQHLPPGLFYPYPHPLTRVSVTASEYRNFIVSRQATHLHGYHSNMYMDCSTIAIAFPMMFLLCVLLVSGYKKSIISSLKMGAQPAPVYKPIDESIWAEIDKLIANEQKR